MSKTKEKQDIIILLVLAWLAWFFGGIAWQLLS
jgi:hypothetical protein